MSAGIYNIRVEKGTDAKLLFCVRHQDQETPRNLSGWSARMQVRPYPSSSTLIDELTTENGRIVILSPNGQEDPVKDHVVLLWPHEVTEKSVAGVHCYDLELVSPTGEVERLLDGSIEFVREVTK